MCQADYLHVAEIDTTSPWQGRAEPTLDPELPSSQPVFSIMIHGLWYVGVGAGVVQALGSSLYALLFLHPNSVDACSAVTQGSSPGPFLEHETEASLEEFRHEPGTP